MTKRAVWFASLLIALLSVASVAYRLLSPTEFDSTAWRADDSYGFLNRRAMMPDLEQMFVNGKIRDRDAAMRIFGDPERKGDDELKTWFYNLGGQHDASAPESISWLEITFDTTGKLVNHRVIQELIVPQ